jgi:DNA-binding protein H-NS
MNMELFENNSAQVLASRLADACEHYFLPAKATNKFMERNENLMRLIKIKQEGIAKLLKAINGKLASHKEHRNKQIKELQETYKKTIEKMLNDDQTEAESLQGKRRSKSCLIKK